MSHAPDPPPHPPSAPSPLLYDLTLVSPWFEATRDGVKRFEGRLRRKQVPFIRAGDLLRMSHAEDKKQPAFFLRVLELHQFESFEAGLRSSVGLSRALPGVSSVQEGIEIYARFYPPDLQQRHGCVFIEVERLGDEEERAMSDGVPLLAVRKISLWIQPKAGSKDESDLSRCISSLSAQYSQAPFHPHVTLATFPWPATCEWGLDELCARVQAAVREATPQGLRVGLEHVASHPTNPFMTLFALLARDTPLLSLRQAVWKHLITPLRQRPECAEGRVPLASDSWPDPWPFVPHMSLLYDIDGELDGPARCEARVHAMQQLADSCPREWEVGSITLVLIDTDRYAQRWRTLASVPMPSFDAALAAPGLFSFPPSDSLIPSARSDPDGFRLRVLQPLDHSLFLRLALQLAESSTSTGPAGGAPAVLPQKRACVLVYQGQVVLSATGEVGSDCSFHAETRLLASMRAPDSSWSRDFFAPERLQRMLLYSVAVPCAECLAAVESSQIGSLVQAFPTQRQS